MALEGARVETPYGSGTVLRRFMDADAAALRPDAVRCWQVRLDSGGWKVLRDAQLTVIRDQERSLARVA